MEWNADRHNMMVSMVHDIMRQERFLHLARHFRPHAAQGVQKIRAGDGFDGAYVMLDDFRGIDLALSFGVGDLVSWDMEMAQRGVKVWQYDHTVDAPLTTHKLIEFNKLKIAATPEQGAKTIDEILASAQVKDDASVILKIDIEGGEWEVLEQCSEASLARFSQIVFEFHGFAKGNDNAWLTRATRVMEKLYKQFAIIHVHGNNWCLPPMVNVSNVYFPDTLEGAFANRKRYNLKPSNEVPPALVKSTFGSASSWSIPV